LENAKLTAERDALVKALREAATIVALYAGENPKTTNPVHGEQDPDGAHATLELVLEALRPYEASDARISPDKPSAR